jgi:hypothetical protein
MLRFYFRLRQNGASAQIFALCPSPRAVCHTVTLPGKLSRDRHTSHTDRLISTKLPASRLGSPPPYTSAEGLFENLLMWLGSPTKNFNSCYFGVQYVQSQILNSSCKREIARQAIPRCGVPDFPVRRRFGAGITLTNFSPSQ